MKLLHFQILKGVFKNNKFLYLRYLIYTKSMLPVMFL